MKKQKLQAGLYMYGGFQLQKEYMGDTIGMTAVRRWNVCEPMGCTWCVVHDAPSLKAAMKWVDEKVSRDRHEKIMMKMVKDNPNTIGKMFRDLGYATK